MTTATAAPDVSPLDRPEPITIQERTARHLEHMMATNPDPTAWDKLPTRIAEEHAHLDEHWAEDQPLLPHPRDGYVGHLYGRPVATGPRLPESAVEFLEAWRETVRFEADDILARVQRLLVDVFSTTALPIDDTGQLVWPGLEGAHEVICHMIRRRRLPLRPTDDQIDQLAEYLFDAPSEEHWERIIASRGR